MVFDISVATALILFLSLFPMSFIWLRRAYRIFIKKNYAEVALKGGEPPENPEKFAKYTGMINLIAGSVVVVNIICVVGAFFDYRTWAGVAGVTLWMKVFADFIVNRQAHPFKIGKDKGGEVTEQKED